MNKTFLILASTFSVILIQNNFAQSIETYHSKTIRPDSSHSINVNRSNLISPEKSKSVELKSSKQIEMHQSKLVVPEQSKQIEPYHSHKVETYHSKEIEVNKGNTVKSECNDKINGVNRKASTYGRLSESQTDNNENNKQNSGPEFKKKEIISQSISQDELYGIWHTKIPGAVWQTPSGLDGYNNLHVSTGARAGDLVINKNGTYSWNSYGGKKGKWQKGDSEYPIVLIDNVEKKEWKVGIDSKHTGGRDIIIWDGNYFWYDGKK